MPTRDELKALIDQLPESRLEPVFRMLDHHLRPPASGPEIDLMQTRSQEYRQLVMERFRKTQKPGTLGGLSGSGSAGMHEGTPFGRHGFSYWDGKALVNQTLYHFDGHQLEVMQRLSTAVDPLALHCDLELSSGGRTAQLHEQFPILPPT